MVNFKQMSQDKMNIMMRFLSSENLCKAAYYSESNFLDQPTIEDPSSLIYNNIYPFSFIPQTEEEQRTLITLSFRKYRLDNDAVKSGLLHINIITHRDLFRTDYGVLRTDYILSEIDELIQQRGLGVGKPRFYTMDELYVNPSYSGLYVQYRLWESN